MATHTTRRRCTADAATHTQPPRTRATITASPGENTPASHHRTDGHS